ncbi:hypothetical protein B0I35DRAFT_85426 [Stachybotrys elegans]|uniref:Zn(2)-C6 fungal-type domain-containing protein n=1 Tax=Stachybotrys elegans TaxID=80388 RepID=A0A8K0SHU2_9HYPO|nr:hypothetical protein B0I35DRAFT_85426 [Stachybotrys elegans]
MGAMNACSLCKRGKRKCNRGRPSCANCSRLGKTCTYSEDSLVNPAPDDSWQPRSHADSMRSVGVASINTFLGFGSMDPASIQQSTGDLVLKIFGSWRNVLDVSTSFFTGTHQRLSAISKLRFLGELQSITATPKADFAALCLAILLIEQRPETKATDMLSSFYFHVKALINLIETVSGPSLNLLHGRSLMIFYELGHGLHTAAYISIGACARSARALGLDRKPWRLTDSSWDKLAREEEKRLWWAIVIMDRFVAMCNRDDVLVTKDPGPKDSLPIEDLLWSEGSTAAQIEPYINNPPLLDTSFNIAVGQMARECQVSHLVGRVVQLVYAPTTDIKFNTETARQLEHTLKAYLPLLSAEELSIGEYCGAFGMCNSALFILYEFMMSPNVAMTTSSEEIMQSIEHVAATGVAFAESSYHARHEHYPPEVYSPYLPYSLCQSAAVQHRLWRQTGHMSYKHNFYSVKRIIQQFTKRWKVAWQYLDVIEALEESGSPFAPLQTLVVPPRNLNI